MASSSSTISVFDDHRFRTAHNEQLFDSHARRRKVIPEVGFNLEDDEYPEIMEQITLRGWRRLAAPCTNISKLLVQELYANAAVSDKEAVAQEELPYKSFVRGKEIDFSPNNIRRVMRFKRETAGALTDFKTRQALNQRLDEDAGVPLREFARTPRIPSLSYITAKRMETTRFPRDQQLQQQDDEEEDEPMPQADGGNFGEEDQQPQQQNQPPQQDHQPQQHGSSKVPCTGLERAIELAKEIQDIQRGQITQVAANTQRFEAERNLQLALERQGRDIAEIRRQVAYACWAQQQANPNLGDVPITQIPDIMRTNVEKGRPLFHGFLKSDYGASSSSQVDPEEPVPLRTAPPSPHFRPPYPPSN
ncbi:hypothetical protein PIB30_083544 [Stylosanthes scabra]|uniref:Uncharacterized protein n=1 Tax=Stylosanthes scabra TaxID=79078 RepID=A0ABU6SSI5_9FABA|nr:hypothetical protein [Stylosanthes scabra]